MTAFTEVLNLYLPGGGSLGIGGDDEVADIDRLNQNFQKIDTFAKGWGVPEKRNQQFYDLAAVRTSLTDMKRGDTFQESDGSHKLWVFDGLSWKDVSNGAYLFANAAERDAYTTAPEGSIGYQVDIKARVQRVGAIWIVVPKTITGSFTLPVQGAGVNQTVPITFPAGVFTAPPNIAITPSNGRVTASLLAGSVTTSGATLGFDNWSGGPVGSPHTVYWTAIGV